MSLNAARASAQSNGTDLGKLATTLFTDTGSLFIFVVQLFLGIGLGYVALRALKYLLALVAVVVLGMVLNVWQAPRLGLDLAQAYGQLVTLAYAFGLTTMLPLTVGFIVGAVIGTLK